MTPELITTDAQMDALLQQLGKVNLIAVDTEFYRETSYYPQLALVQIATDTTVACVDPLAFNAKPALQKLLHDDRITKIFHSCSQDLEVLYYYLGEIPCTIYDTQIANALLSENHQAGYASLVEKELGKLLDKSQTRSNWLQRPLTEKQILYAGDDVIYLYQLHTILEEKLKLANRKSWFNEESSSLSDNITFQVNTEKLWQRVKGASKLNKNKLAIVQSIAIWRELIAQQKDKTRRKILSDDTIIQLATNPPENTNTLNQLLDRQHNFEALEKQHLFDAIQAAKSSPESEWPDNRYTVLDNEQKTLLKSLQHIINEQATKLGISSAIICSRKDLEKLVLFYNNGDSQQAEYQQLKLNILLGWRYKCVGAHIIETIKNSK